MARRAPLPLDLVRRLARAAAAAAALAVAPAALAAQAVAGRVVEDPGGKPAAGAVVTLVAPGGGRVAPTVTDADGRYRVAAAAGRYRLRVDLIGYETWLSPELALAADTLRLDVQLPLRRVRLDAVKVAGTTECAANPQDAPRTVAIWEEVRRALTISGIAERRRSLPFELRVTRREVDAWTGAVRDEQRARLRSDVARPWVSARPGFLAEHGFVVWERDTVTYFIPGTDVLLSEEFLATHCFAPVRKRALLRRLVGLSFTPAASRAVPEVQGTIWLDEGSSELRSVEFTYLGVADRVRDDEPPGGEFELARLPSGLWYIRRWALRIPDRPLNPADSASARVAAERQQQRRRARTMRYGYVERVGEASVLGPERGRAGELATVVAGVVVDSTTGAPLAGARVSLPGEPPAVTDAAGRYAIRIAAAPDDSVAYTLGVSHPRFAALGVADTARAVVVRRWSVTTADFAVPPAAAIARACAPEGATGTGLVAGRVVARGTPPPAGTEVTAEWTEYAGQAVVRRRVASATSFTDAAGRFLLCGVPVGRELALRAAPAARAAPTAPATRVTVGPNGVAEAELALPR